MRAPRGSVSGEFREKRSCLPRADPPGEAEPLLQWPIGQIELEHKLRAIITVITNVIGPEPCPLQGLEFLDHRSLMPTSATNGSGESSRENVFERVILKGSTGSRVARLFGFYDHPFLEPQSGHSLVHKGLTGLVGSAAKCT